MSKTVIISCWFGERFTKPSNNGLLSKVIVNMKYWVKSTLPASLYSTFKIQSVVPKAPTNGERAIFFTNNKLLKKDIQLKGWEYSFIASDTIGGIDSVDSSLQAKKIKFLQLEKETLNELYRYDYILYVDSRAIVDDVDYVKSLCDKGIVIKYSPLHKKKLTIWGEVDEAAAVERYAKSMPETIDFIKNKITSDEYTDDNRVMATGVILYKIKDKQYKERIESLCKEVYTTCVRLNQPECQIIWCLLSQPYDDLITKVEAEDIVIR